MSISLIIVLLLSLIFPLYILWHINRKYSSLGSMREYVAPVIIGMAIEGICIIIEKCLFDTYIINGFPETIYDCFFVSFFRNAFVEEAFKLIGLYLLIWLYKNKPINKILLYAIGVAIGFSMVENVGNIYLSSAAGANVVAFSLGRIVSTFVHLALSVFLAFFVTKFLNTSRLKGFVFAFLIAFLIHGAHDFIVSMQYYLHWGITIIAPCILLFDILLFLLGYKLFRCTIMNYKIVAEKEDANFVNAHTNSEPKEIEGGALI